MLDEWVVLDGELALDGYLVDGRGLAGKRGVARVRFHARHAVNVPHEVEMPGEAAEFAVGDHVQAGGLFLGDKVEDGLVFDGFQRLGGQLAALERGAGLA